MAKQIKKRPLQMSQDDKTNKTKKAKTFKSNQVRAKNNQIQDEEHTKVDFEKKAVFADLDNGDAEVGKKNQMKSQNKKKSGMSRSEKFAPKPGPKEPEVLEKRRERRKQKSLQRKMQKAAKKAKGNKKPLTTDDQNQKSNLEFLDDLLSNSSSMTKEQIGQLTNLIAKFNADELKVFCGKVIRLISNAEVRSERVKLLLIEKLGNALRSTHLIGDQVLLLRGIKFLALNAFFAPNDKAKNVCFFSAKARDLFKVNLHRSLVAMFKTRGLAHSTSNESKSDDSKPNHSKEQQNYQTHLLLLNQLIDYLSSLLFDANSHFVCIQKKAKQVFESIVNSQRQLRTELRSQQQKEQKEDDATKVNVLNAFITFYDLLLLLCFEDSNSIKTTFDELEQCLRHAKHEVLGLTDEQDNQSTFDESDEQPKWADVLCDIVISYLLKPSQLIRNGVTSVFSLIKDQISEEAIEQVCLALISDENEEEEEAAAEADLELDIDEENENEDDEALSDMEADSVLDEDDEDEKEDTEIDKEEDDDDDDDEAEEDDDDDDDVDIEEDDEVDDVDEEFRRKLKLALGKAALDSEDEEDDDQEDKEETNNSEAEDDDMDQIDDEEMLKFDEALVRVFKERKTQSKQSKNISHLEFKSRCLDLVEQLANRKQISLNLLIQLSEKLIEMNQKSLSNKTTDLIRRSSHVLCQIAKSSKPIVNKKQSKSYSEQILKLFHSSIDLSSSVQDKTVQNHLYDFSIWCIQTKSKLNIDNDWSEIISKIIEKYFKSGNFKLTSTFFVRLCILNKDYVEQILKEFSLYLKESKLRLFKQTSAYQVLIAALNNADDKIVSNLDESLIEQHTSAVEQTATEVKKNSALLFNNQVIFVAILLNKYDSCLNGESKKVVTRTLSKIANDSKCKRSFSKESKIRLKQFMVKPSTTKEKTSNRSK